MLVTSVIVWDGNEGSWVVLEAADCLGRHRGQLSCSGGEIFGVTLFDGFEQWRQTWVLFYKLREFTVG